MAEENKNKQTELEKMIARRSKYMSPDPVDTIEAAPSTEEMDSVDARDPKEFFEKKINDLRGKAKMADGGMARGKGNKMYQHNYATGGSVTDHLKKVPEGNEGLKKLPKDVRNKMGYMKRGGMSTKR
jgi:hypothetical protein